MSPDRYNPNDNGYNPNDPNYVQNQGRRNLGKDAWKVAGALATIAGAYEFFTQVLPGVGKALGGISVDVSSGSQNSPESSGPEWYKNPIISDEVSAKFDSNGNAESFIIDAPPGTILWLEVPYPPDNTGAKIYLIIEQNDNNSTNWGENILALSFGPVHRELYKPTVMVSDAWHTLLTSKKEYLSQKYDSDSLIDLSVDNTGNAIDINEDIKISDIS